MLAGDEVTVVVFMTLRRAETPGHTGIEVQDIESAVSNRLREDDLVVVDRYQRDGWRERIETWVPVDVDVNGDPVVVEAAREGVLRAV